MLGPCAAEAGRYNRGKETVHQNLHGMATDDAPEIRLESAWRRRYNRLGYWYVLPAALFFILMTAWPILRSLYLSFFDYYLLDPEATRFVGFGNYAKIFTESVNHLPFWNTLRFTVIFVPPFVIVALIVAVMLNELRRGSVFLRTMIFTPVVVSMAVSSVLWLLFYDAGYGMGQKALEAVLGKHAPEAGVLGDKHWAMGGIALMCLWNGIGVNIILFLVGLGRISEDVYEAALVDGASPWQRFWHVTLPQLRGTTVLVVLLSAIGALKVFGQPYIMTGGGPADSTQTFVMRLYELAFRTRTFEMGYASALAYALAAFIFVVSAFLWKFNKPAE